MGLGRTCPITTCKAGRTLTRGSEQLLESLTSMELTGSSWEVCELQPSLTQSFVMVELVSVD